MTLVNLTVGGIVFTVSEKCRNGHTRTAENSSTNVSDGKAYIRCKVCHREQMRRADKARRGRKRDGRVPRGGPALIRWAEKRIAAGENEQVVMLDAAKRMACSRMGVALSRFDAYDKEHDEAREQAYNEILEARFGLAKDDSKKPWKYLQIKPDALAAWDAFNDKLQAARDTGRGLPNCEGDPGPWMDYDENLPTAEEAYSLCDGCPLLAECGIYVELERPAWGVWAGDVWVDGEIVTE